MIERLRIDSKIFQNPVCGKDLCDSFARSHMPFVFTLTVMNITLN